MILFTSAVAEDNNIIYNIKIICVARHIQILFRHALLSTLQIVLVKKQSSTEVVLHAHAQIHFHCIRLHYWRWRTTGRRREKLIESVGVRGNNNNNHHNRNYNNNNRVQNYTLRQQDPRRARENKWISHNGKHHHHGKNTHTKSFHFRNNNKFKWIIIEFCVTSVGDDGGEVLLLQCIYII